MPKWRLCFIQIQTSRRPGSVAKLASQRTILAHMPLYQREATMAGIRLFDVHRTWEDYIGIILGILIGLSPWLTGGQVKLLATGNAVAVGVMVLAFAAFELVDLNRSE